MLLSIVTLSRVTYYYYVKRLAAPDEYAKLVTEIEAIYTKNCGRYGYRHIADELRNRGCVISHKTILSPDEPCGTACCVRAKKYHAYAGDVGKIAPNLSERELLHLNNLS